ncbi:MAG: hypothetical protein LBT38_01765 [Deltaproteobacteria bacterium]|nr:hypothetical protein [Deltaproteobacteria bacterium]
MSQKEKNALALAKALDLALSAVRAEENFPAPLKAMGDFEGESLAVINGAKAFAKGQFAAALSQWEPLAKKYPENLKLVSLTGAAHLRGHNYALAAEKFRRTIAGPPGDRVSQVRKAQDALGLSLALFQLRDFPGAHLAAQKGYDLRVKLFGPFHRETVAAANIFAVALMGANQSPKALELLVKTTVGALEAGLKPQDPVMADCFGVLGAALERENIDRENLARENMERENIERDNLAKSDLGSPAPDQEPVPAPEITEPPAPVYRPTYAPLSPADYAQAKIISQKLKNLDPQSPVLPELLTALIETASGGQPLGAPPNLAAPAEMAPDLAPLCLELTDLSLAKGQPQKALAILESLAQWAEPGSRIAILAQKGAAMAALERWPEAEVAYREALELFPAQLDDESAKKMVALGLALSDTIFKAGRLLEEAELELVAIQTLLKKKLSKKELSQNLGVAKLNLRLGQILKLAKGRGKDSARYFQEAQKIIARAEKTADAGSQELAYLKNQLNPKQKNQPLAPKASLGPTPESLRLELTAYKLIGHIDEFETRIATFSAQIKTQNGDGPLYRRYLSLWLKFLEEKGDTQRLLQELDFLAQNPLGQDLVARNKFALNALYYKAKVLTLASRKEEAIATYRYMLSEPNYAAQLDAKTTNTLQQKLQELESRP